MKLPFEIDYVFPGVNDTDKVGRENFIKYCKEHGLTSKIDEMQKERFRDGGLLRFLFRAIEKNMPGIRRLHLIVSNKEQVPQGVDQEKVHIVLHEDIIPKKYLPTFNSTAIEMFLANIPDLAEHFLYGNDDMFPMLPTEPDDGFTPAGVPCFNMRGISAKDIKSIQFRVVCAKEGGKLQEKMGVFVDKSYYRRPWHTFSPLVKSKCNEVINLFGEEIDKSISPFRTPHNMNQYIYTNYMFLTDYCCPGKVSFQYIGTTTAKSVLDGLRDCKCQTMCINDCASYLNMVQMTQLQMLCAQFFLNRFPEKSQYEKEDLKK